MLWNRVSVESSSSTCWQCDLNPVAQAEVVSILFLMGIIMPTSQGGYEDYYLLSLLLTLYSFFSLLPVGLDPIYRLGTNPIHIPRRPGQALGRQNPVGVVSCPPEAPSLVVQLAQTQRSIVHSPSAVADTQMWWHRGTEMV